MQRPHERMCYKQDGHKGEHSPEGENIEHLIPYHVSCLRGNAAPQIASSGNTAAKIAVAWHIAAWHQIVQVYLASIVSIDSDIFLQM